MTAARRNPYHETNQINGLLTLECQNISRQVNRRSLAE